MDPGEMVKMGYDAIGHHYLASRTTDSQDVTLLQELVERLSEGAEVLDVGCGPGVPVTRILAQRFKVTGVDISEVQIALARQQVPQARFLCQDMTRLHFPDDSFEAICSYYAIIHVPRSQHRQLLLDFRRMLRPGGLVLLCMGAGDLPEGIEDDYFGVPMYWSHFDAQTNVKLMEECGFRVLWARIVEDETCPGGAHLFIMAEKS